MSTGAAGSLAATLDRASRDVRAILDGALDGAEVSVADGITLAHTTGRDLQALTLAADVVRRAREAWEMGATEVCIQAGLPPKLDGRYYINLTKAIKAELPDIHIHAFSPEEVLYGTVRSGLPIKEYL